MTSGPRDGRLPPGARPSHLATAEAGPGVAGAKGLSARAVAVGLALVVTIASVAVYADIIYNSAWTFGSGSPCIAGLASLLLLAVVNPRLGPRGLTRRELLAVYCIALVGGTLVTKGILGMMLSSVVGLQYYGQARPHWQTTFLPAIPIWYGPTDPGAIYGFFEGRASVPWSLWWKPLGVWFSFLVALFACEMSLVLLLRQQWIRNERLSFPMAQLPLEMIQHGEAGPAGPGRVVQSSIFWIGVGVAFGITFLDHLSWYVPALPTVPVYYEALEPAVTGPMAALGQINIIIWPDFIAIAYLIPKDISFSCWVFWVVRVAVTAIGIAAGGTPRPAEPWGDSNFPAPPFQGAGALLALGVWGLWLARPHLAHVLRSIRHDPNGEREAIAYQWVLVAAGLSFAYLIWFYWVSGMRVGLSLLIVGLIVTYHMVWAKVRAETGVGFNSLNFPLTLDGLLHVPAGSGVLRQPEVIALYTTRWAYSGGNNMHFEVVSGNAIEGMKIADSARLPLRPLVLAMAAAFVLALAVGMPLLLRAMYPYGFVNTGSAQDASGNCIVEPYLIGTGDSIHLLFTSTVEPDRPGTIAIIAGALTTLVLGAARVRFWWWPLNPVGYMLANLSWGMNRHYLQFFIGWVAKTSVLRWGGLRLYRRTLPLAVGIIIGTQVNSALWAVASLVFRRWL